MKVGVPLEIEGPKYSFSIMYGYRMRKRKIYTEGKRKDNKLFVIYNNLCGVLQKRKPNERFFYEARQDNRKQKLMITSVTDPNIRWISNVLRQLYWIRP